VNAIMPIDELIAEAARLKAEITRFDLAAETFKRDLNRLQARLDHIRYKLGVKMPKLEVALCITTLTLLSGSGLLMEHDTIGQLINNARISQEITDFQQSFTLQVEHIEAEIKAVRS
jgi:hypothetical protein